MTSMEDSARLRRVVQQTVGLKWPIYYNLPDTRGLWPLGGTRDVSGYGQTLTNAGSPSASVNIYMPYYDYNGTTAYSTRTDSSILDITAHLTMGGWFYFDDTTPAATEALCGKYADTGNNRSYLLGRLSDGTIQAWVSSDGAATTTQASTETVADGVWAFCAMRYIPSSELSVFVGQSGGTNGLLNEDLNTTSIPAAIANKSAAFTVAALDVVGSASNFLDGRASMIFLCASALSDNELNLLYTQTRTLARL